MLSVRNLRIKTSERIIVDNINFELRRGVVSALVGKSGAGKSLCATSLLLCPPAGVSTNVELHLDGKILVEPSRSISVILQNPRTAFNPLLTIYSHAKAILKSNEKFDTNFKTKLSNVLKKVNLDESVAKKYPFELSGGMLQRVIIALSLITEPSFIIADEPTTDLDAITQAEILTLLKNTVKSQNIGILIITHDFGVLKKFADEILVLEDGMIVEYSTKENIFAQPKSKSARELLKAYEELL